MPFPLDPPPSQDTPFESYTWGQWFQSLWKIVKADDPPNYTNTTLPVTAAPGTNAFVTNGRKAGEGAGAGTGVPVYYSHGAWRLFSNDRPYTI